MSDNGNNKATITCPACHQKFSANLPAFGIVNDLRFSQCMAVHEKPIRCICGKYLIWMVTKAEAEWGTMLLTDEQAAQLTDKPLILPPPMGTQLL